ncbi:uncharacterized protein LOC115876329 [Sitophilus oryzae]|uniref:Uncharacterized protein LOC115876329 n=1 Tax=Sitophilus oryzae TaxID=7048 RepID=A0A6J2XAR8_SITOR|nr:uncharacterized protein LOC115876329 [Sitophilus oryzae]
MDTQKGFAECEICDGRYRISAMLQNNKNMFFCRDCFKKSFVSENKMLGAGDAKTEVLASTETKFIPKPEQYVQNPQVNLLRNRQSMLSMMSLSKRPLKCPMADCGRFVSVCTLESHFRHEHDQVPTIGATLDARCASRFHPLDIRYCIIKCIVLLKLKKNKSASVYRQSKLNLPKLPSEDHEPIVIVMATRISNVHLTENPDDEETTENDAEERYRDDDSEVFSSSDKIMVWVGSNFNTNLNYTVAVSTLDNNIRQKYYGPIMTLNESPTKICQGGQCLILTNLHCNAMTEQGKKQLLLDVVIHSP